MSDISDISDITPRPPSYTDYTDYTEVERTGRLSRGIAALKEHVPITLSEDAYTLWVVFRFLQISLLDPEARGNLAAVYVRDFAKLLESELAPPGSDLAEAAAMGWRKRWPE